MLPGLAQYDRCCIVWRYYLSICGAWMRSRGNVPHDTWCADASTFDYSEIHKPIFVPCSISTFLGRLIFEMKRGCCLVWQWRSIDTGALMPLKSATL